MAVPGFMPFVPASLLTTVSLFGTTTIGGSVTVTAPANIVSGDLIALFDYAENVITLPTLVIPTGFTSIISVNNGVNVRLTASYKIANGSEGGSVITGQSPDHAAVKFMWVFRGDASIATVSASSESGQVTDNNPSAINLNASGSTPPLVMLAYYSSTGAVSPTTFTPTEDGQLNPGATFFSKYKIYNTSPANTTVDMDDEGALNSLMGFYLVLA